MSTITLEFTAPLSLAQRRMLLEALNASGTFANVRAMGSQDKEEVAVYSAFDVSILEVHTDPQVLTQAQAHQVRLHAIAEALGLDLLSHDGS